MKRREQAAVFGLSFLDAITCGLGAVILLYMVLSARMGVRSESLTRDLSAETDRLERDLRDATRRLVELRNSKRQQSEDAAQASGLARRLIEELEKTEEELAASRGTTLATREHVEKLKTDIQTLEREASRLKAARPADETPGDRVRPFIGDGDRQYLTGLKLGGERVLILVDASASMLDETLVNVVRLRNLPAARRRAAEKWRHAVLTVDWLATQLPRAGRFQVYVFDVSARPLVAGSRGRWLDAADRTALDAAVDALRELAPGGGTSLHNAFAAIAELEPPPDNLILVTDGLPTQGERAPRRSTVSPKERLELFERALARLPRGVPVNVILFPMEGDAMAPAAFWKLAMATRGSLMSPSRDWP